MESVEINMHLPPGLSNANHNEHGRRTRELKRSIAQLQDLLYLFVAFVQLPIFVFHDPVPRRWSASKASRIEAPVLYADCPSPDLPLHVCVQASVILRHTATIRLPNCSVQFHHGIIRRREGGLQGRR